MSQAILSIQKKIGVKPDGNFGPMSAKSFAKHFRLNNFEAAHLLGQCHHESMGFKIMVENMNYSAARLLQVFPKYFDAIQAKYYGNNPAAIANKVYANRMGNGDEQSCDGWNHRGMGPLQLTGKNNQERFLKSVGKNLYDSHLIMDELAFDSAVWFFKVNNIFLHCKDVSQLTILKVSRAVNIGNPLSQLNPHGMDDRIKWTLHYFNLLTK